MTDAITHAAYFDDDVRSESLEQEARDKQKLRDLRDSADR